VDCQFFARDKIGDGSGIGECSSYEKGKANNPTPADLDKAFKARGAYVFYPNALRTCRLFKRL